MTNEELSFRTKQALAAALKTALERKKLSKITVSELAEACQVNRKTFYYHFQDVYALFRWMLEQEAIDVVKNFDLVVDTEEALRFVMEYVDENKHLINGAFDSMGYEEIKRFFYNDLFSVLDGAISQGETELGVRLDPGFKKYLATFYTEASAGLLMEWIKSRDAYEKMRSRAQMFIFEGFLPDAPHASVRPPKSARKLGEHLLFNENYDASTLHADA